MSAADHAHKAIAALIAQGYVPGPRVEAIVLAACEGAAADERELRREQDAARAAVRDAMAATILELLKPEPIDNWLRAAPFRMITLMVDREQQPPRIVAMLDEGMLERGRSSGATCAEANANALNNVMVRQYK